MLQPRKDKKEVLLNSLRSNFPKVKLHFSGSTPPDIFVGRVNYPHVFSGILSPAFKGETRIFSSPEDWVEKELDISEILRMRSQMVYGRKLTNIKSVEKLDGVSNILAMASRPVSTEFFLRKIPQQKFSYSKGMSIMANPAPIKKVILEENPRVEPKVDYIVSDLDAKAEIALQELYKNNIAISQMQKIFSVGLLGLKTQRKLVPTKWGITAIDDSLSKFLLKKIKTYQEINEIRIFKDSFNGNNYHLIFLPGSWSFEVLEADTKTPSKFSFWQDYEGFAERKSYASSVTGAYYANRLGVAEYLEKIKRQAQVLILREITEDYYAPLGVGILREITRRALKKEYKIAGNLEQALQLIEPELKNHLENFKKTSWIYKNYGKQKKLSDFY